MNTHFKTTSHDRTRFTESTRRRATSAMSGGMAFRTAGRWCHGAVRARPFRTRRAKGAANRIAFTSEIVHPSGLFFDRTVSVLTERTDTTVLGWLFFDASCAMCSRWSRRLACLLRRRGLRVTPLQSTWAHRKLRAAGVYPSNYLREMRLLLRDGTLLGGGDALIHLAGQFRWSRPLQFLATHVPLARRCIRWLYRKVAQRRRCNTDVRNFDQPHRDAG